MKHHQRNLWPILLICGFALLIGSVSCSLTGSPAADDQGVLSPTETPTPTPMAGVGITPTVSENRCAGISGALELQVLVGPADIVGLEPIAIGSVPFSVVPESGVDTIQGSGGISYQDVLAKEWGTYTVNFEMDADLSAGCSGEPGREVLDITVIVSGEQMVEVQAKGFQ